MKTLGIDLGTKTIGIAVSDEMGIIAHGVKTLKRIGIEKDIEKVLQLTEGYSVDEIVVGLPVNMNGTIGPQAKSVLGFVERIKAKTRILVTTWDERLSTSAVTKVLIEGNVKRKRRREVIDKIAAVYILQGYLDNKRLKA